MKRNISCHWACHRDFRRATRDRSPCNAGAVDRPSEVRNMRVRAQCGDIKTRGCRKLPQRRHQQGENRERNLANPPHDTTPTDWPDRIHAVFKQKGVNVVGYVPDTGHARLMTLCQEDNAITDVVLTSEAEGPGLILGAALGGQRTALLMQSSGV